MSHYDTLEVSPQASPEVIRAAYKSLMQRFHPDKNPGNGAIAQRAGLITLAYDTLSDPAKRAAYDHSLEAARQSDSATPRGATARRVRAPAPSQAVGRHSNVITFFWAVVLVIVVAGGVSLWLLKSSAPRPQVNGAAPMANANPANSSTRANSNGATGTAPAAARQAPDNYAVTVRLGSGLRVLVTGASSEPARVYALTIPTLLVHVGRTDAGEFARYLDLQGDTIHALLAERLAAVPPDPLFGAKGEQFLSKLIFEALADITGTDTVNLAAHERAKNANPAASVTASERYGVVGVSLPDGFALN